MPLLLPLLWITLASNPSFADPTQPAATPGRFSQMQMLLERTIFNVDVLKVTLRVGDATRDKLKAIAKDSAYNELLQDELAKAAYDAPQANVQVEFLRNVSLDEYVPELIKAVKCPLSVGMIDQQHFQQLEPAVQRLFTPIAKRGFKDKDVLIYEIDQSTLHITLKSSDGTTLIKQTETGVASRNTALGSYLASCSEYRTPLIKSLFSKSN